MNQVFSSQRQASNTWLDVRVTHKWSVGAETVALRLEPVGRTLPECAAGAHIDIEIPGVGVRQYSLINGPADRDAYVIGVKLEQHSRGGSSAVHHDIIEGHVLRVSLPRNTFPLAPGARESILIAGGIGITPLLSMARTLSSEDSSFQIHYFARSAEHVSFRNQLEQFVGQLKLHLDLIPSAAEAQIAALLAKPSDETHVYACGPEPMLQCTIRVAERHGWSPSNIHYEFFGQNITRTDCNSFIVELAKTGCTLEVPFDKSILEVMREAGMEVETSCEQGVCGTCLTKVLAGEPDHHDVFLTDSERARGDQMTPCVSRAKSPVIVLDL